ncbi:MAG: ribosome silencing factor [Parachlamydiales bacterium]|nr:ribosome silencing factor [Verrucomicrobiota bacterium]MBX3719055.1 ribosome silencing factor [Candidatus Acheromyda pituitae]
MKAEPLIVLNAIAQTIYDKKGFNILALDVRGVSSLTDFVIIAEGNVDRHVKSIGNAIMISLKELGLRPFYTEGLSTGDWVVLDYMEIMVHLFMPGLRDKYMLEQLWRDGAIVDLQIDTAPKEAVINSSIT